LRDKRKDKREEVMRNVRNFWVEAEVDGRKERISFGPKAKDGGFGLRIFMREKGGSTRALTITGSVHPPNTPDPVEVTLYVEPHAHGSPLSITMTR
jgi:hypothetical protein